MDKEDLLKPEEVAREYPIGLGRIRSLYRSGDLASIRLGRRVLIRRRDVQDWIDREFDRQTDQRSVPTNLIG